MNPLTIGNATLYLGDSRQVLCDLPENSVASVVCDPPYGLVSIQKRFGGENAAPAKAMKGGDKAFQRLSKGFMGKQWDGTGTERDPEFWRLVWKCLKPG